MEYYKYTFENIEHFLEYNEDYCERAVFFKNGKLFNTFLFIDEEDCFLPEKSLSEHIQFIEKSSEETFKKLWKKSLSDYIDEWEKLKKKFKIGDVVQAKVKCFYPQGIISNFGEFFNCLSDYNDCYDKFGSDNMYPNKCLQLKIAEFDDENMIIKLEVENN